MLKIAKWSSCFSVNSFRAHSDVLYWIDLKLMRACTSDMFITCSQFEPHGVFRFCLCSIQTFDELGCLFCRWGGQVVGHHRIASMRGSIMSWFVTVCSWRAVSIYPTFVNDFPLKYTVRMSRKQWEMSIFQEENSIISCGLLWNQCLKVKGVVVFLVCQGAKPDILRIPSERMKISI